MANPSRSSRHEDQTSNSRKPTSNPQTQPSWKGQYLIFYNALSFALWSTVLYSTIYDGTQSPGRSKNSNPILSFLAKLTQSSSSRLDKYLPPLDPTNLYARSGTFIRWTQTLAILEVVHAGKKLVRASPLTTATQVASRLLLVWVILEGQYGGAVTKNEWAYVTMVAAWSVSEVVRYSYYVNNLLGINNGPAKILEWLRYSLFIVMYPIGIFSECLLVYKVIPPPSQRTEFTRLALMATLLVYTPGSIWLYSHMLSQRKRQLSKR